MNKNDFVNFFKPYAKNVDNANKHGFWKLSDQLIEQIIKDNIPVNSNEKTVILDAGGGTGRWVSNLSNFYKTKFIVFDLSKDMLDKARINIADKEIENRVTLMEGDLRKMDNIDSESIDYVISIYSPISFIYKKEEAFNELFRILKKSGKVIIMGHGFHNALFSKINNYCADISELNKLEKDKLVKWAEHVPELNVFSKEIMEEDLSRAGFKIEKTYGVPVFVQPGGEDFDPGNIQKSRISQALENQDFFDKVFEIEMKHNSIPSVVNRGVNIFSIGIKE